MLGRALIGYFFMKKKWMVHRDGSGWRHCRWNSLPARVSHQPSSLNIWLRCQGKSLFKVYSFKMMQPLKSLVFLKTSRSIFSQTARLRELAIWSVQKKRLFCVKNVLLCYKRNGQCLGRHEGSWRCSRLRLEHLLRYLRALPTIRVHPELDGRSLGIVHSLISTLQAWVPWFVSRREIWPSASEIIGNQGPVSRKSGNCLGAFRVT